MISLANRYYLGIIFKNRLRPKVLIFSIPGLSTSFSYRSSFIQNTLLFLFLVFLSFFLSIFWDFDFR